MLKGNSFVSWRSLQINQGSHPPLILGVNHHCIPALSRISQLFFHGPIPLSLMLKFRTAPSSSLCSGGNPKQIPIKCSIQCLSRKHRREKKEIKMTLNGEVGKASMSSFCFSPTFWWQSINNTKPKHSTKNGCESHMNSHMNFVSSENHLKEPSRRET